MAAKSFHEYMRSYSEDHQNPLNRATHLIGIPMIVASLPLLALKPKLGVGLFTAGWALQLLGHKFEGKKPSFTSDPRYLAIGPVWIAVEWVHLLTGIKLYTPPPAPAQEPDAATPTPPANGADAPVAAAVAA